MEAGLDVPEQINKAHEDQPGRQYNQRSRVALPWPRQQEQERDGEMEYHQAERDHLPSRIQATGVKAYLHRQVSSPDDQHLREAEICPQHDEGEHQLAVVVDFLGFQQRSHGLIGKQNALGNDHHAHRRQALSDDEDESKDARIPMRIYGHNPVDQRESNGEGVKNDARRGNGAETRAKVLHWRTVLLRRPAAQNKSQSNPDGEINYRPPNVPSGRQIRMAHRFQVSVGSVVMQPTRPPADLFVIAAIKVWQAGSSKRDEKHSH